MINKGSLLKFNINIQCENKTMDELDFICVFFTTPNSKVEIDKVNMIRKDENNYIAVVDTSKLPPGSIKVKTSVFIEDSDCPDGKRTEITTQETDVTFKE